MSFFRASTVIFGVFFVSLSGCSGCHEEPTIVIRFEPTDADVKPSPAVVIASPSPTPATPSPGPAHVPPVKHAKKECKVDADCAVVPDDCCDCANGGRQQAIPKKQVATHQAERGKRCGKVMCTMMFSTDPTCGMRAACAAGQCTMVKKN
jgi:hypothetical protein